MSTSLEARLQALGAVQAIGELKADYCNAADGGWGRPTHDADRVASLFMWFG